MLALNWNDGLNALIAAEIEAIVFRTVGDQPSLWESILPEQAVRRLPGELARLDALLGRRAACSRNSGVNFRRLPDMGACFPQDQKSRQLGVHHQASTP